MKASIPKYIRAGVRIAVLAWACWLISWSVRYVFVHNPPIGSGALTALGAIIGILTVAVGLYEWRQGTAPGAGTGG